LTHLRGGNGGGGVCGSRILWQLQVSKGKQSRNIVAIASVKRKKTM